jgi:uncharacterized protein
MRRQVVGQRSPGGAGGRRVTLLTAARPARITLPDKVAFLRDRRNYPGRPHHIDTLETHFAWVFLTPRHAYKLKKPLRQGRMDYRSLAARKRGCLEELRLNRRLASTVYRALEYLSSDRTGRLHFGRAGHIEDYLIKMRRLPAAAMLDRLLERHAVSRRQLDRLVRRLVAFFASAAPHAMSGPKYLAQLRRSILDNRRALRRFGSRLHQSLVTRVIDTQLELSECIRGELAQRAAHIVEGHGDLRAEHVCLGRSINVIDCLEFDRNLRRLDPAQEIALLALEIERLSDSDLAERLLQRYRVLSSDRISNTALQFYMSLNALTRAKLAAWHVDDPQFLDPAPWIRRTHRYLCDALRHSRLARQRSASSVLVCARRPVLEQFGERLPLDGSAQRMREQRRHGQHRELGMG